MGKRVATKIKEELKKMNNMKNFGFIRKKKVAMEIAKIYNEHNNTPCTKEQFMRDCEAQSALNFLCGKLNIKPMHLNKLGGGTGEMIGGGRVMSVACDTTECAHNDGIGFCELLDVYISSSEAGEPICQDAKFEEDDDAR